MNLSALHGPAVEEFSKQPIVVLHAQCTPPSVSQAFCLPVSGNIESELVGHLSSSCLTVSPCHQDTFDFHILMARSVKHCINFKEVKEEDINRYLSTCPFSSDR